MAKYIFVTGGVVSGVGKGVAVASIGRLLRARGISVAAVKLDPYLNVDPGTMNPYQHGECFVTEDGAETDLDLGHYERIIDVNLTRSSNLTSGQVYSSVIARERRGEFLGGTIQVIPHITNEIKARVRGVTTETGAEVVIAEVGGVTGDIENLPFLEAVRQLHREVGTDNAVYIHVTLLPYLHATGELKTKPTQQSVRELRSYGIQPDAILCRSDFDVSDDIRDKIALFCDVEPRGVVPLRTVDTIYSVPRMLEDAGMGDFLVERLRLNATEPRWEEWDDLVRRIREPKRALRIAIVGKYVELPDSYLSIREALIHAGVMLGRGIEIDWVNAEHVNDANVETILANANAILVAPGFGPRGIEGKIAAARYARVNRVPYLGDCLGMQVMTIEFARYALSVDDANSTEMDPDTAHPVIDLMPGQRDVEDKGGTMRLGAYACRLIEGTRAHAAYGASLVYERHRHRYEFNNEYRERLGKLGLRISGVSPDGKLVEIVELDDHPFMVGSQFHPEYKSRPTAPHPLFRAFVAAAIEHPRDGEQVSMPLELALAR
ncbi:MAG: CTP synthase [Chloroflexota bacterium]|nr:MAG: CTP synthase [Chloroflexota bacterium]